MTFKTADLSDANEGRVQVVLPGLHDFGGRARFHGQMVTLRSDGDFIKIRELVTTPGDGRVLVVDDHGDMTHVMFGDRLATAAAENGWSGIVIHGCTRDAADIAAMDIGIKALATNPRRGGQGDGGEIGVELEFLGAVFRPGEYLYSDQDGILLSPEPLF